MKTSRIPDLLQFLSYRTLQVVNEADVAHGGDQSTGVLLLALLGLLVDRHYRKVTLLSRMKNCNRRSYLESRRQSPSGPLDPCRGLCCCEIEGTCQSQSLSPKSELYSLDIAAVDGINQDAPIIPVLLFIRRQCGVAIIVLGELVLRFVSGFPLLLCIRRASEKGLGVRRGPAMSACRVRQRPASGTECLCFGRSGQSGRKGTAYSLFTV